MLICRPVLRSLISHVRIALPALLAISVYPAFPSLLAAQSFDCSAAGTASEKAICEHDELGDLDEELLRVYRLAIQASGDADAMKADGRRLWAERRDCKGDVGCLEYAYRGAISHFATIADVETAPNARHPEDDGGDAVAADEQADPGREAEPVARLEALVTDDMSTCERDMTYINAYIEVLKNEATSDDESRPRKAGEQFIRSQWPGLDNLPLKLIGYPKDFDPEIAGMSFCEVAASAEERVRSTSITFAAHPDKYVMGSVPIFQLGDSPGRVMAVSELEGFGEQVGSQMIRARHETHPTDERERERIDLREVYADTLRSLSASFPERMPPLWVSFSLWTHPTRPTGNMCEVGFHRTPLWEGGKGYERLGLEVQDMMGGMTIGMTQVAEGVSLFEIEQNGERALWVRDEEHKRGEILFSVDNYYDAFEQSFEAKQFIRDFTSANVLSKAEEYPTPARAESEVVNHPLCQEALKSMRSAMVVRAKKVRAWRDELGLD